MFLYHFSDKNINKLKISFFGYNHYTNNDKKFPINRLFFYDTKKPREYHLKNCEYCYIIKVNKKDIYNLDNDILNLKEKYNYDIMLILQHIKNNFLGCHYNVGFDCYCIFKDIIPIKKIKTRLVGQA